MKKFKFKLEAVLSERKRIEDFRLREWTIARREVIRLIEELSAMEKRLARAYEEATALNSAENVGMLTAADSFISGTKLRMTWKKAEIERAMKAAEKRRLDYVHASQKRSALEKLKERKLVEYRAEAHKRELKTLDDIYIMNGAARGRIEAEQEEEAV